MSARGRGCLIVLVWTVGFWLALAGVLVSSYPLCMIGAATFSAATLALGIEFMRQA